MEGHRVHSVVFLPGGLLPAAVQYEPLLNALGGANIRPLLHDLEVYRDEVPPPDYRLALEVEGLRKAADAAGLEKFHLVGYSAGGAVSLAFVGAYPDRVISLALTEPASVPSPEWFRTEHEKWSEMDRVMALPPNERMPGFIRFHLRPGVQVPPPPAGEPPPWMKRRPAGLHALNRAFADHPLQLRSLQEFTQPVYLAVGSLSDPIEERKAEVLSNRFPDFFLDIYEGRHHFDPPQRAEPERYARALLGLWERAERKLGEVSGA